MPHKKKQNIRKLTRMGGGRSIGLILPADILRDLHWRERQKVLVRHSGKKVIIEDWLAHSKPLGKGGSIRRAQGKRR